MSARELVIQAIYLAASVLFILGLKSLTRPDQARRGMQQAAVGMLLAIVGTLLNHEIVGYRLDRRRPRPRHGHRLSRSAMCVPMTAMPQRIALSHTFGALAATLVGVAEYRDQRARGAPLARMAALGFEVLLGSLTVTGSFMAFGKLQELHHRPTGHVPRPERRQHRALRGGDRACSCYVIVPPPRRRRCSTR